MLEAGAAIFVTGIGASIVAEFFPPERQWVVIFLAFALLAVVF